MTLSVNETEAGFEITWDPDDPIECMLNDWTEDEFRRVILEEAERVLAGHTFEEGFMAK